MADGATLLTGQSVLLNVKEELRIEPRPVQTLLRQTEELTVKETAQKPENVTHMLARVRLSKFVVDTFKSAFSSILIL